MDTKVISSTLYDQLPKYVKVVSDYLISIQIMVIELNSSINKYTKKKLIYIKNKLSAKHDCIGTLLGLMSSPLV